MPRPLLAILVCLCSLVGCAPSAIDGGFDSGNPAAKMYAVEQAAREGDVDAACHIVEQLDSDDPAVRFLAISALERLTGQTLGYDHADPPHLRKQAIRRWVAAIESGAVTGGGQTGQEADLDVTATAGNAVSGGGGGSGGSSGGGSGGEMGEDR